MVAIIIDDEIGSLKNAKAIMEKNSHFREVHAFINPLEAIEWLKRNRADVAFLDIEMLPLNGFSVAKEIKEIQTDLIIVFVTAHDSYALEAYRKHINGYMLKPICAEDVENEVQNILQYRPMYRCSGNSLKVQTFGNFEVYYNEEPIRFKRAITKEIFAYLIDRRGAAVTMGQLEILLTEYNMKENSRKSLIRTAIAELKSILKEIGKDEIIIKKRNSIQIRVDQVECDFYDFLKGKIYAVDAYMGEYMANYSWAEFTSGELSELKKELH